MTSPYQNKLNDVQANNLRRLSRLFLACCVELNPILDVGVFFQYLKELVLQLSRGLVCNMLDCFCFQVYACKNTYIRYCRDNWLVHPISYNLLFTSCGSELNVPWAQIPGIPRKVSGEHV